MHCAKEFEKEKGIHFGYYCLISGQDYPIRNVSSIRDELQNSYPKPYIDCTPCAKGNWVYNGSSNSAWWNSVSAKINQMCIRDRVLILIAGLFHTSGFTFLFAFVVYKLKFKITPIRFVVLILSSVAMRCV